MVILVIISSLVMPSITVLLTLGGSLLGTVVTIIIPVMFYNRAYQEREGQQLIGRSGGPRRRPANEEGVNMMDELLDEPLEPEEIDRRQERAFQRQMLRKVNYLVLAFGCVVGGIGFCDVFTQIY